MSTQNSPTFTTQTLSIGQDASAQIYNIHVRDISWSRPGPFVYIQSSVHGAELQGNLVIHQLVNFLRENPFNGTVRFVAMANPQASAQKLGQYTYGRFNPITGHNWNRNYLEVFSKAAQKKHGMDIDSFVAKNAKLTPEKIVENFKSYIAQAIQSYRDTLSDYGQNQNGMLNLKLQELAAPADIVLDLHTGPVACRYIYSAEYAADDALHFAFPHILKIPHEFAGAMDEACFMPWIELREKISLDHNILAYTLELGSEERIDSQEAAHDTASILRFLRWKKLHDHLLPSDPWIKENERIQRCLLADYRTYYSPVGGLSEYLLGPGQPFEKDQLMARHYITNSEGEELPFKTIETRAKRAGIAINHNTSAATPMGAELYQVMENTESIALPALLH